MGTPMRVPVYKSTGDKVQVNPVQLFNQLKIDPLPQEQSVGQDVLNQVTQRNTTANSKYTHCIPKLISVERSGDPPESPSEGFLFGGRSRWDGCADGTCINAKEVSLGVSASEGVECGKISFNRRAQVIGHDSGCRHARSLPCPNPFHRKSCLKPVPRKQPEVTATQSVVDREAICIQKIYYIGNSTRSSTKTTPMADNRTRRVFAGSKPLRCRQ